MSFKLTELIVESVLRDGLKIIKDSLDTSTDIINDVFGEMLQPHLSTYYGQKEINVIKDVIKNDTINVTQGYSLQDVDAPTISISLSSSSESEQQSAFEDFLEEIDTTVTPENIVDEFDADSYNSVTGNVDVNSSDPDLSAVRVSMVFVDGDGNEYPIIGGINNTDGLKHFMIDSGQTITNLVGCVIRGNVGVTRRTKRAIRDQESVVISIMTTNQLLTKYIYTIVKYIFLSNKDILIERGLELVSYDGSDFMRPEHLPNNVFARFFTIKSGFIEHSWLAESRVPFGYADPAVKVLRDVFRREDEDELTVETIEDDI